MSRGWESKDVESQQEQALADRRDRQVARSASEELMKLQKQRDSLQLSRVRVQSDLSRASHPRHRQQLEAALAHVDAELAKLQ